MEDPVAEAPIKQQSEVAFWGVNDPEELEYEDQDEAIEAYLEQWFGLPCDRNNNCGLNNLPTTIVVLGYRKLEAAVDRLAENELDRFLEYLDAEFGNPEDDYTKPTEKMKAAAKAYVAEVLSEYEIHQCEAVKGTESTIVVLDWIKTHKPEWLGLPT